jgi:hydroxylamine reductase (hybrid-cluster protein)
MPRSYAEVPKKRFDEDKQFLDTASVGDLLCYIARGIAPYADAMRRYSVTDKDIDMFIAEALAASGSAYPLPVRTVERYVRKATSVRDRAKTLVEWAAEACGRTSKPINSVLDFECLYSNVWETAENIRRDRRERLSDRKVRSWYELCETRLKAFASIVISSMSLAETDYDAYGFIHKTLLGLSGEKSLFELAALSQLIDKEMLKLVNLSLSGDTLVDVPRPVGPVRTSRIISIDPEPVARVMADWV